MDRYGLQEIRAGRSGFESRVLLQLVDPALNAWARRLRAAPAEYATHFAAVIESTWIVLVLASSVPMTLTFRAANFSGVRWSLSV